MQSLKRLNILGWFFIGVVFLIALSKVVPPLDKLFGQPDTELCFGLVFLCVFGITLVGMKDKDDS
jgi:hypothetical protein